MRVNGAGIVHSHMSELVPVMSALLDLFPALALVRVADRDSVLILEYHLLKPLTLRERKEFFQEFLDAYKDFLQVSRRDVSVFRIYSSHEGKSERCWKAGEGFSKEDLAKHVHQPPPAWLRERSLGEYLNAKADLDELAPEYYAEELLELSQRFCSLNDACLSGEFIVIERDFATITRAEMEMFDSLVNELLGMRLMAFPPLPTDGERRQMQIDMLEGVLETVRHFLEFQSGSSQSSMEELVAYRTLAGSRFITRNIAIASEASGADK